MKNKIIRLLFLIIILLGILIFFAEVWGKFNIKNESNFSENKNGERFDPSILRLRSVEKFTAYCDSVYGGIQIKASDTEKYATIISITLRNRFYHGYSYYSLGQNSLGYLFAPLIKKDLSAIVIPNDILKHPMAACSQQSIIGMEVFERKGIKVRKVGFFADGYGGHFCFEAFFNGKWHFFDPDMEPRLAIMIANHFPAISELVKNDSLLHMLYYNQDSYYVEKLFPTYNYGTVDKFPAPHARVYQYATKFFSYTSWIFFIILYFFVQKKMNASKKRKYVRNQRIH